jgi:hypothetical protein
MLKEQYGKVDEQGLCIHNISKGKFTGFLECDG